MDREHAAKPGLVVGTERLDVNHLVVDPITHRALRIEEEGHAARHAGTEVPTRRAEDDRPTAGHVLATVIPDSLDDGGRAGVADAEALPNLPSDVELA